MPLENLNVETKLRKKKKKNCHNPKSMWENMFKDQNKILFYPKINKY